MLTLNSLIAHGSVACKSSISSKKKALEVLSQLLASKMPETNQNRVFDSLLGRERLGTTALGKGIAIPHARLKNIQQATGAFITLEKPIDYDAPDKQAVDMLFALTVPESCNEDHLKILASLARMFSDEQLCEKLRQQKNEDELLNILYTWQSSQSE